MIFVDYSVIEDCWNTYDSYGEICTHCGCCRSMNNNMKDMYCRRITKCKEMLEAEKNFDGWWYDNPVIYKVQKKNVRLNILYFKRKIRMYKKILKTLR